ncbi:TROVE domain-containing protein [Nocardiopsis synnemataformans]|uniref:vWA domain-containing protein n=1 Tax=Nocardiopsis synnemataformans TaxID=61305 RepID=UPI003EBC1F47
MCAKFNGVGARPVGRSPVLSESSPSGRTHEGGAGYARDARSELFLLAVTNMVGEKTFYETAADRDDRFTALVRQVAVDDPEWLVSMIGWLRGEANMRSASLVAALEGAKARVDAGARGHSRQMVNAALQRADEPGEALAYWTSRYGRSIPKPVKRGIADGTARLYNERSVLKYDTDSKGYRFGDVLNLVHASPREGAAWQGALFKHVQDRRRGRGGAPDPALLPVLAANAAFSDRAAADPGVLLDPDALQRAGLTWEAALSLAGDRVDRARLWEAIIPSMGYMALLRNLRGFDEAGVSDAVAERVMAKLTDPAEVERSRQLPMRFLSAYRAAPSLRWGYALERALSLSLANVPTLSGRTLIMVDTSGSMRASFSKDGALKRWDAAALFGIALGQRCAAADVVSFSSVSYWVSDIPGAKTKVFDLRRGESLLGAVKRWDDGGWFLGGGTDTAAALREKFAGHDRVVVVTDEQANEDPIEVDQSVPSRVPMYTWNLAGYERGHAPSGQRNRYAFGGLSDAAFGMIPLIEAGRSADWPWV